MSTTATVSVGSGSTSPIVSLVFAEMVSRSQAVQEAYMGDLYHDALTLNDLFLGASTGSTVTFWWVLRPYGTYLTTDQVQANILAGSIRRATVYRFVVREKMHHGDWVVEITRERVR